MLDHNRPLLERLFPITFTIHETMNVSGASSRLLNLYPLFEDDKPLLELFKCYRPNGIRNFEDLKEARESLYMLISGDKKLALKGQILLLDDSKSFLFVGMPWLTWMNEQAPDTRLHLGDFPKLDSQMDQEFLFTSQQTMVRDLEELNQKLILAEGEAKEAHRIQSDLFAVMSHEMRTPLNSVISALSLLADENEPLEQNKLTNIAHQSAHNLLSVINYTLDYFKIDAGRMTLKEEDFNISALLESVIAVTESKAKEKELPFSLFLEPGIQQNVRGDSEKLRQILINIVGNAIKFTDSGNISVRVTEQYGDNHFYCFSIADTGSGIKKEDLGKIFDPFWGKSSEGSGSSTGLGLNIVKRLIEVMNGSVAVRSEPGEGTTFEVYIPLSKSAVNTTAIHPSNKRSESSKLAMPDVFSGKVLLVDDNQTNLMLGEKMLERQGVSVRTATNGQEAVDIARDVPFDLILMDISMPVMDGVSATRKISQMDNPPPVVALTANVRDELIEEYLASGFKGFLKKPLEQEALITELNLWLKPTAMFFFGAVESEKEISKKEVLESLWVQIGETNFRAARKLFLEETNRRLHDLLAAWVRRDLDALRKEAHAISSSVASFGCDELAWRLKRIEHAASANDISEIVKYMKDIEVTSNKSLDGVINFSPADEVN